MCPFLGLCLSLELLLADESKFELESAKSRVGRLRVLFCLLQRLFEIFQQMLDVLSPEQILKVLEIFLNLELRGTARPLLVIRLLGRWIDLH